MIRRDSALIVAWLVVAAAGFILDSVLRERVLGVAVVAMAFALVLLTRRPRWLWTACAISAVLLLSPFLLHPETRADWEEVIARPLAAGLLAILSAVGGRWNDLIQRVVASEYRLKAVATSLSGVTWNVTSDNRIVAPQSSWSDFTGQSYSEYAERGWLDAIHAEDRPHIVEHWLELDPNAWPERYDRELRLYCAAARGYRYVRVTMRALRDENGQLLTWMGMLADVHDRKVVELALAQSQERLRAAQQLARLGHWELREDGLHVLIEGAVATNLGLTERSTGERTLSELFGYVTADVQRQAMEALEAIRRDGRTRSGECSYVIPGDARRVCAITARRDLRSDGTTLIWGTVQDVTERDEMHRRERELENQLMRSRRMEQVGELSSGLAHDFNNMLASILGYGELARARDSVKSDSELASYLDQVLAAGTRAKEVIRTLMSVSRSSNSLDKERALQELELTPIAEETLKLVRASIPNEIVLESSVAPGVIARTDRLQLQEMLLNLFVNARDAVGAKGRIQLTVYRGSLRSQTCSVCGDALNGEAAIISVVDDGVGIASDVLPHIFKPFFTTKQSGKGTGLGLAMVARMMHGQGGHVLLDSQAGRTEFRLVFSDPVIEAPLAQTRSAPRRLLIVDDDAAIGRLIAAAVEPHGYASTVFTDPRSALSAFDARPNDFDLIVTDLSMGGLSGLELAAAIRRVSDVPVLLLTGGSVREEDLRASGALSGFLRKPFALRQFLQVAAEAMAR